MGLETAIATIGFIIFFTVSSSHPEVSEYDLINDEYNGDGQAEGFFGGTDDNRNIWTDNNKQASIHFVNVPDMVDKQDISFTIWCKCLGVCSLVFNITTSASYNWQEIIRLVHVQGREHSVADTSRIESFEGNLTFIATLSKRDVYYDFANLASPTNVFARQVYLQVSLYLHNTEEQEEKMLLDSVSRIIPIVSPSERMPLPGRSSTWYATLKRTLDEKVLSKCTYQGRVDIIPLVAASAGDEGGFMRKLSDISFAADTPPHIIHHVTKTSRCSVTAWIFLTEYCSKEFCSILTHRNQTVFLTPSILLNKQGALHVQLHGKDGQGEAFLTSRVPLRRWIYVQLSIRENQASLLFADDIVAKSQTVYSYSLAKPVYCKPSDGFWNAGGYHSFTGFTGFLGPCRLYMHRYIEPHDTHFHRTDKDRILKVGVSQLISKCRKMVSIVDNVITYKSYQPFLETCKVKHWSLSLIKARRSTMMDNSAQIREPTAALKPRIRKSLSFVLNTVRQLNATGFNTTAIAEKVLEESREIMFLAERGRVLQGLEIAGCLGSSAAYFEAGALLTAGFCGKADLRKALQYQLLAAMRGYGLAQLALGYKYQLGAGGVAKSCVLAAGYIKSAGLLAKYLIENEKAEVHTHSELIRLDEAENVANFRGEESEVVEWLSQQAVRGSKDAQGKMAEILFHGHHGVNINRNRAVDFYRLGAEQGDPLALYNLGVLFLRGIEVEKNLTKGKELFLRSAAKNFSLAFNSLGYVEMVLHKNKSAAAEYFRRGIELDDQESMFHYGTLLEGGLNGQLPDKHAAMVYFQRSANKGQKAACFKVGEAALLREIVGIGCKETIGYYRYVAEQLPDIGKLLRQGLDKYLSGNWQQSMMGYLYAAEAGLALGAFNMALLCEEYQEVSAYFNGTCQTYFYNISGELGYSASLVAMGDRYWTGKGIQQDLGKSAVYYARALEGGDSPQALYSLGYLVENNYNISSIKFALLKEGETAAGNISLAGVLYERCMQSSYREYEGYYPCLLATVMLNIKVTMRISYFGPVLAVGILILVFTIIITYLVDEDIT